MSNGKKKQPRQKKSAGSVSQIESHVALFNEKLETIKYSTANDFTQLRMDIKDLRLHMDEKMTQVFEKTDTNRERLIRLESEPAHVEFQSLFCPNTKDIAAIKKDFSEIKNYFDGKFKALEESKKQQRNRFYTLLGAVVASAISALINLLGG